MPGPRPILVASKSPLADQIQDSITAAGGQPVQCSSFDDCRDHLTWNKSGLVLLAAARPDELDQVANIVREVALRQSPLTVVIVHDGELDCRAELAQSLPYAVARLPWPAATQEVCELVADAQQASEGSASEELAQRLLALTPSLVYMADQLALAAAHDLTVLLTGETGSGKTFLARLLHEYSTRRNHPFLMVPCGAQTANLFESCFFGHVKGAFTSAHQSHRGKFAAAGKGTILLDEIDTLGLEQQASLLRVIESGEYEQVGGHVTLRSEARIIAASNWNLEEAVEEGKFRQDLYYRLNVLSFHLPPLRERVQDIAPLARAFAAHFSSRFNKPLSGISPEALAVIEGYSWPGNIRQLENMLQQAVLMCRGSEITERDLPEQVRRGRPAAMPGASIVDPCVIQPTVSSAMANDARTFRAPGNSLLQSRADYERHLIQKTLEQCRYNRSSAARALGVSRVTLHKKIKQYGLAERS